MNEEHRIAWEALQKSFPKEAYKEVSFGRGFTTIDAYHIVERLTDVFGLCGEGWGFGELEFQVHGSNVACIGSVWYRELQSSVVLVKGKPPNPSTPMERVSRLVHAVGDAQVIKGNIAEAYKKAQTNLLSKAASYLGVGLSVYQGKGLDDPYLDRAAEKPTTTKKTVSLEEDELPW